MPNNRLALVLGLSNEQFQIPNQQGLEPSAGLDVEGVTNFLSNDLNENQHELAQYAILSWQHSQGALKWQSSAERTLHQSRLRARLGRRSALQRHRPECLQRGYRTRLADRQRL